tara:strand:- start:719 stop:1504 length:786 start_codon:yes stop_codon:yes gene_type:complete
MEEIMWKFQLEHIDDLGKDFLDSFDRLPETDHLDGKYRLRRYSVFQCEETHQRLGTHEDVCVKYGKLPARSFTQSSEYNTHQGDVERKFADIEDITANSNTMQKLLHVFHQRCFYSHIEIEVHQMRVITRDGGKISPEGIHQDGYDRIAMLGVNRHNISGGHLLLYNTKDGDPIVNMSLENGDMAFVNDKELWHNGSPIKKKKQVFDSRGKFVKQADNGHMDILIMLANFVGHITWAIHEDQMFKLLRKEWPPDNERLCHE